MGDVTYVLDDHTNAKLSELRDVFGAKNNAEVLKKAIALAQIVAGKARAGNTHAVTIGVENKFNQRVLLNE